MRTHYCGLIDESLIGQTVTLCGWVNKIRLQAHVAFVDLRDHEGLAQVVIERENAAAFAVTNEIGNEAKVAVGYRSLAELLAWAERYTRTEAGYRYESGSFTADLEVDADGLVTTYSDLWRRA